MNRQRIQPLHGFTLVELLVVITVMGVLTSMLLPSLFKARNQAVRLICTNNLRQQGIAHVMYANDFTQLQPNGGWTDGNFNSSFDVLQWAYLVDNYTRGDARPWVCPTWKRYTQAPTSQAGFRNGAMLGGGYGHRLPCLYAVSGPKYGMLICGADPQYATVYKAELPHSAWPDYLLQGANRLERAASSRVALKSEQCITPWVVDAYGNPSGTGWFGDTLHPGTQAFGTPEGGNILYVDLTVGWSTNVTNWANVFWVVLPPA